MRTQFRMGQEILDWDEAISIISRSMKHIVVTGHDEVCGEIGDYPSTYLCMDRDKQYYLAILLDCIVDGKDTPLELVILRDE